MKARHNAEPARPDADAGPTNLTKARPLVPLDSALFKDVNVAIQAKLGLATLSVEELLALRAGSVVKLDVRLNELIELRLNQSLVARGEIVAVDDHFGVRIVEIAEVA
ncbi:MAG TPA: FliM/FliN family flagellar motor switch protein [Caulobacteraceae bacterium]|nr:FliM/FliN family flagellar motor switch protein [Caulobacteraceae bacterium]